MTAVYPVMGYEITIPVRTVSLLNVREHWAKRRKRAAEHKMVVQAMVRRERLPDLPATVTLTRLGPRRLDTDNLAASNKNVRDAIAGIYGVDDGDDRYTWSYAQDKSKEYGVRISIEPRPLALAA